MISILIPVYNFLIKNLVDELHQQCMNQQITFEIILLDDNSENPIKEENRKLSEYTNIIYEELPQNIGRAAIRNKLAAMAKYPYLLFIDNDTKIGNDKFVEQYVAHCKPKQVVFGGLQYELQKPPISSRLRWKYGIQKEQKDAVSRSENPYKSFNTINFLIDKETFSSICLDESIVSYGHEDTLFGIRLKELQITIKHIENPIIHICSITNEKFIQQTQESLKNLLSIFLNEDQKTLCEEIKLLQIFNRFQKFHITRLAGFNHKITGKFLRFLIIKTANITLFELYKLNYFCYLYNQQK